ncbi:MAG: hypothetical protein PHV05_07205 [Candidatus Riflebacteria bacterium]|nr:hypothetical protein [Candidatus Riflebacteria bacterium]
MNSKQLFFFSLLLLSVAMGMHWFKNRPKTAPQIMDRPRTAINIGDLQLQDGSEQVTETGSETADIDKKTGQGTETASGSSTLPASETVTIEDPLTSDPVIIAFKNLKRNLFEKSPYSKLAEEARALSGKTEEISDTTVKKSVSLLTANFSATINIRNELVAIIDSRLYRKGDVFQDKKITEILNELVVVENKNARQLIPKTGVNISIAEDGTYTVEDSFHKN